MTTRTSESIPEAPEDGDRSSSNREPMCGQCGFTSELDCVFCQACGSLLPDADPNQRLASSGGTDEIGSRRVWPRVVVASLLLLSVVATAGMATYRATEPKPEEQLAEESSHRALALLKSMSEARTLAQAQAISPAATSAMTPVVEMLPRLSSNNDTRTRLDAYRSLFRGLASLDRLHQSRLLEWGKARQLISSSLRELSADDPMTGALTSQGRIAMDAIQDHVDKIERLRSVAQRQQRQQRQRADRSTTKKVGTGANTA